MTHPAFIHAPAQPDAKVGKPHTLRDAMVLTTAHWLPQRGMAAVNLIEVARAVNAPRGSIYHYFPGGRDQLLQEALALAGKSGLRIIEKALRSAMAAGDVGGTGSTNALGASPKSAIEAFVSAMFSTGQLQMHASNFSGGCPVGAAVLSSETESADFQPILQAIFASWQTALVSAFMSLGAASQAQAGQWAHCTLIAYEGALVCAKAERDPLAAAETFHLAARMVVQQVNPLPNQ